VRRLRFPIRRLRRDEKGATIVEFALVSVPFLMLMLGLIDIGYHMYLSSMIQGTLNDVARQVTVGGTTTDQVKTLIQNQIALLAPKGATITVVPQSYYDFTGVKQPEPITTDTPPLGVYNHGDCFLDYNGNGVWDADQGTGNSTGGSDDIAYYTVTVSYVGLVPLQKLLGWSPNEQIVGTMMMRNQPYASQPDPATVCT
jgi:Flp pilus assembly protein TadG